MLGTLVGEHLLRGIPERSFRRIVANLLLILGGYMILRGTLWVGGGGWGVGSGV